MKPMAQTAGVGLGWEVPPAPGLQVDTSRWAPPPLPQPRDNWQFPFWRRPDPGTRQRAEVPGVTWNEEKLYLLMAAPPPPLLLGFRTRETRYAMWQDMGQVGGGGFSGETEPP